jgi:2,3-bisphosphoglycerate-dependent phosphoglycerate mutase
MAGNGAHAQSEPTRIVAIRHGETAWNVDTRIQGQLDVPLNDKGRWQAERLALALGHEAIAAVYASDLLRAHETALAIVRRAGPPVVTDSGLRERAFGVFEGRTFKEIEMRWPEQALRWRQRDPDFGPEGGEQLRTFFARCIATAARLAAAHAGQTIALVAHGGVLDCLYRAATRLELQSPRSWQLGNASINRLLHTPQGFTLIGWSDTLHLEDHAPGEFNDADARAVPAR